MDPARPLPQRRTPDTGVLSVLHLTEAEPLDPRRPLWKRFKRRDLFVDDSLARLLAFLRIQIQGPAELVLNGDVFDFEAVMALPWDGRVRPNWLERRRGLVPERERSAFKMQVILRDHPAFLAALREWVLDGNEVVFVIGNHDLELHWPEVQQVLVAALSLPPDRAEAVRFCEWFVISGGDTLITHGNQFDRYCVCQDPIHPLIEVNGRPRVRLPFGNLAGKYLLNGMGWFNPHAEASFIKPAREYLAFFYRHIARSQPFLLWTWFWSACVTLYTVVSEGLRPSLRDPLTVEDRVEAIAEKARTSPRIVRSLRAVDVHPALFNPWMVARELWLDRALLLLGVAAATFQMMSTLALFDGLSPWWGLLACAVLLPPVLFYSSRVQSDTDKVERSIAERLPLLAAITGVERVIMGHTHLEKHVRGAVEYLNTGNWSPAFRDMACTEPYGRRCFAWLRPEGERRRADLYEWRDPGLEPVAVTAVMSARRRLPGLGRRRGADAA